MQYCQQERLTFTRSRPYRNNDNCYGEQKNYTMVRRHVGYQRLVGPEQLALVNKLYEYLRLYTNYFQPLMKLKSKEVGKADTNPCQRVKKFKLDNERYRFLTPTEEADLMSWLVKPREHLEPLVIVALGLGEENRNN